MQKNSIKTIYKTQYGKALCGDSLELLDSLKSNSVNLVITSPPFALLRKKTYGNKDQEEYVNWLALFAEKVKRVLTDDGSFVVDLGGAYQYKRPVRSLYNYRVLLKFCDELGFNLAEEFFWYNPSKLPSPIEWVNKRKIRTKDSVNTVWWFSKSDLPKANVKNVLNPYSERMQKLISNPERFYNPKSRPSGHAISSSFGKDNGGSIPSNLIVAPNTESNSCYLARCKSLELTPHPARFPKALPEFFIKMLTEEGDTVLDIFAGSNTTGETAEELKRRWISCDICEEYVVVSSLRFLNQEYETYFDEINDYYADPFYIKKSINRVAAQSHLN